MYSEKVIDHFKNPRNMGALEGATVEAEVGNPVCGDIMKVYLKILDNRIEEAGFETMGCVAAIATSSMMTELAKGKTVDEALKISFDDILKELGGLPDPKVHCSQLAVEALHKALKKYKETA